MGKTDVVKGSETRYIMPTGANILSFAEVQNRHGNLLKQLQIGLRREKGKPVEAGSTLAIRTGIPSMTPEAWNTVLPGTRAIVADIAGTNWTFNTTTKGEDGTISIAKKSEKSYGIKDRKVTFAEFINRMAEPIAQSVINEGFEQPVDIGISFGFPHENSLENNGIGAKLLSGKLPKEWEITDFDPQTTPSVTNALQEALNRQGITVNTLIAINDTPAVALDGGAAKSAIDKGFEVLPAGFVGGSGTNGAIDNDGLVNTELGHVSWPLDDVFAEMKKQGWIEGEVAELEHETGMYLPLRLAAIIKLYEDRELLEKGHEEILAKLISQDPNRDQALITKIANGEYQVKDSKIRALAQNVLERAGQVYGIALTALADAIDIPTDKKTPRAFLVEGGTLLHGYGIRETAEITAEHLGQPITITPAVGLKGIGTLAMAYPFLEQK